MLRHFLLRFIRIHIALHHAAQGSIYGAAMMAELQRHGYALSPGTLYPILHRLETAGYLTRDERVVEGKVRKYYTITAAGRAALADTRGNIAELAGDVLDGPGPEPLPDPAAGADDDLRVQGPGEEHA